MKKLRILLVDDSLEWLKIHQKTLVFLKESFDEVEVVAETSAQEALQRVMVSEPFELIISDMEMENMGKKYAGEWLIENLKELLVCSKTKFLILSGAPNIRAIADRLDCEYIGKPYYLNNPQTLIYKICELFE